MVAVTSDWETGRLVFRDLAGNGIMAFDPGARVTRFMSVTDIDAQDGTIEAAAIKGGIIVHTSADCDGTLTFDTAENILAEFPSLQVGECIKFFIINDGNQTVTLADDDGCPTVTVFDAGQTIAENEAAVVLLRYSAEGAFDAYVIGA